MAVITPYLIPGLFTAIIFSTKFFFPQASIENQIYILFFSLTISSLLYYKLLNEKEFCISIKLYLPFIFIISLLTPSILQNDQFRYVWDGLMGSEGLNPYLLAPNKNPFFNNVTWARIINHPHLETIYPPLAQILFTISTYLNPYFLFESLTKLTDLHQVILGIKVLFAIFSMSFIYLFRKERWYLVICHPLYLYTFIANTHIDGLLIIFMAILYKSFSKKTSDFLTTIAISAVILIKWYPLIFTPGLFIKGLNKKGLGITLSNTLLSFSLIFFAIMIYYKGAGDLIFTSLFAYSKDWYFNGYVHHFMMDFFEFFMSTKESVQLAKIICLVLAATLYSINTLQLYKCKIGLREWLLHTSLIYLAFSPTLMPWYLLIILPSFLYMKSIPTVLWLWPILTISSKAFFFNNQDPVLIRYISYAVITYYLYKYLKSFFKEKCIYFKQLA